MLASPPACLLQAVQSERLSCIAIDPATDHAERGAVHYCQPLLALLADEPPAAVQAPVLLVLFLNDAKSLPEWIASLALEIQQQPAPGAWCLKLANGLPLTLLLCERYGSDPLPTIEAALTAATNVQPTVALVDGENMPSASRYRDLPGWFWRLAERSDIALALLACAAFPCEIRDARKRCHAMQCLYIQVDGAGKSAWLVRYHGYVAPNQLSPEQSQYLQAACLHINQAEKQICANWLALDYQLRQQQACGNAWFKSYQIDADIQFVLRQDDPRWRANSDNDLLLLNGINLWMALIENYDPARPKDFRNLTPDAPPQLADCYQGRIFFCLHAFQALSWADIAAIGAVRYRLNVSYGFAQRIAGIHVA